MEVYSLLKQLHSEANRKPNSVRSLVCSLAGYAFSDLRMACSQVFVDHFAGEIDAQTGKPIRQEYKRSGTRTPLEYSDGYGFYGALSQDVEKALEKAKGKDGRNGRVKTDARPGTRIAKVEL